jgi:hypothetical protein
MLFKKKLERLFRIWHITSYKKKKTKQIKSRGKHSSAEKQSLSEGKE